MSNKGLYQDTRPPDHLYSLDKTKPVAESDQTQMLDTTIAAIFDQQGIILALSKEATAFFGARADQFIGRSILSLAHKDDCPGIATAIGNALNDRSSVAHCEFRIWRGSAPALRLRALIRAASTGSEPTILVAVTSGNLSLPMLEGELDRRSSELGEMAHQLVLAQREERRKLAKDMHDSVGHSLALAKFQIDGLREYVPPGIGQKAIDCAGNLLADAIESVRSLTFALNSTALQTEGLDAAIEELGHSLSIKNDLQFTLTSRPRSKRLNKAARISLYRIIRELLVNVIKHAHASSVRVSIGADEYDLHILVADNGIGMSQSVDKRAGGTGLASIRNEITDLDGQLTVESGTEGGTRIFITLPYSRIGEGR